MKIALDVDGLLSNFYLSVSNHFGKIPTTINNPSSPDWILSLMDQLDDDFWNNLEILNPASSISFDFDIYLTSLPERFKSNRELWLRKHNYPNKPVIVSDNKLKYCKKNDIDILIDDNIDTIRSFKEDETKHIIQYLPYYFSDKFRVDDVFCTRNISDVEIFIKKILFYQKSISL